MTELKLGAGGSGFDGAVVLIVEVDGVSGVVPALVARLLQRCEVGG